MVSYVSTGYDGSVPGFGIDSQSTSLGDIKMRYLTVNTKTADIDATYIPNGGVYSYHDIAGSTLSDGTPILQYSSCPAFSKLSNGVLQFRASLDCKANISIANTNIFSVTFGNPIWCISTPLKVTVSESIYESGLDQTVLIPWNSIGDINYPTGMKIYLDITTVNYFGYTMRTGGLDLVIEYQTYYMTPGSYVSIPTNIQFLTGTSSGWIYKSGFTAYATS